jgi:hypothetical protein
MNSAPERRERLTFEKMRSVIDALHDTRPLRVVIFAGGEPTLLGEELLEAIAYADGLGAITRMVTNAFWATTDEKAHAKITDLRQAGLAELNISADDYHLPYIPFGNVARAWRAAKGRGFRAVVIANCYGPRSLVTPQYVMQQLGETLPERFGADGAQTRLPSPSADGTVYMLSNSYLQRLGRGRGEVGAGDVIWPTSEDDLSGGCPWAVRSAALSPRGHLVACCGIEAEGNAILDFGDAAESGAQRLVEAADQSIVVNAIAMLGPLFIRRFVQQRAHDVAFRSQYATVCEVCEDVVRRSRVLEVLQQHMPALAAAVLSARAARESACNRSE